MLRLYRASRAAGFPFWWSIRTAWAWRKGPNTELRAAHRAYTAADQWPPEKIEACAAEGAPPLEVNRLPPFER